MNCRHCVVTILTLFTFLSARAQKVFNEGVIIYKVILASSDKEYTGTFTYSFKGDHVRKELKLNGGYQDVIIFDCGRNKVYSLQNTNNKKFAIELSMAEILERQQRFDGFLVKNEENTNKKIAGHATYKGTVTYKDGSATDVLYTKEWRSPLAISFDRFPNASFLPLSFSYKDDNGITMTFQAEKVELVPIENAMFRIPPDYKTISYSEYKQMNK